MLQWKPNNIVVQSLIGFGVLFGTLVAQAQVRPLIQTNANLYQVHQWETQSMEADGIKQLNERDLKAMNELAKLPIDNPNNRLTGINGRQVQSLIDDLNFHPVVGYMSHHKYDPSGGIGFCFGRALYIHLLLLHLGVDNDAIKKIWAVGPMDGGSITWGFHVATFVKASEEDAEGWWVVDNFTGRTMSLSQWIAHMYATSIDGNLRFYFSDAQKFGVSMGKYDPFQLGVYLPEERDVYRNYFRDIMDFFKTKKHVGRYPELEQELQRELMAMAGPRLESGLLNEGLFPASRSASMVKAPIFDTDYFESLVAVPEAAQFSSQTRYCEALFH